MPVAEPPASRHTALSAIPREITGMMRPELPALVKEMASEITATIPEYSSLLEGGTHLIRLGIEQNVAAFLDQVGLPPQGKTAATLRRDEMCRQLGRLEAYEGRSLDRLQEAYRIGCQVALRRARTVGRRYQLSAALLMTFADALFAYMGEIAELSREGYLQAMSELGEEPDSRRRRLLRRVLSGAALAPGALDGLAEQASWTIPTEATMVALHPGSQPLRTQLDPDVLADLTCAEPYLLVPGRMDPDRRITLDLALDGCRAAIGPTTLLAEAADSLRWARRALALSTDGILPDRQVIVCEEHLLTLWLLSDTRLLRHVVSRYLEPLSGLTPTQRARLVETLHGWLSSREPATQVAADLGVHPQTVRYRMRSLERLFGARLENSDERFGIEVALRAARLQAQAEKSAVERQV